MPPTDLYLKEQRYSGYPTHLKLLSESERVPSSGQVIALNPAYESAVSNSVSKLKVKQISNCTSNETVLTLTKNKSKSINNAFETSATYNNSKSKAKAVSHSAESSSALLIYKTKLKSVLTVYSNELANSITKAVFVSVGIANEVASVLGLNKLKNRLTQYATELNQSLSVTKKKIKIINRADEVDYSSQLITPNPVLTYVNETQSALGLKVVKSKQLELIYSNDLTFIFSKHKTKSVALSTELNYDITVDKTKFKALSPGNEYDFSHFIAKQKIKELVNAYSQEICYNFVTGEIRIPIGFCYELSYANKLFSYDLHGLSAKQVSGRLSITNIKGTIIQPNSEITPINKLATIKELSEGKATNTIKGTIK